MRKGLLQAGRSYEAVSNNDPSFNIPTAVTTGQIHSPALVPPQCLKCGKQLDPMIQQLICDNCRNINTTGSYGMNIIPQESCPNLDVRGVDNQFCGRIIRCHDFGHRYRVPVPPLPPVDDEAEIRRIRRYHNFISKKSKRWFNNYFEEQKCSKSQCNVFHSAMAIHDFPAFQISMLLRNFGWCGLYLWTTTLVDRKTSNDRWDTSGFPEYYHMWEDVFMWMITWDYCVLLFAAQDQLK